MTNYPDMADLRAHIDSEGVGYFFVHYTSADQITVAGEPLPEHIITAAYDMAQAIDTLQKFFS